MQVCLWPQAGGSSSVARDPSRVNYVEFVLCQVRGNEAYSEAKGLYSTRKMDVLMIGQSSHKWWSTLKLYTNRRPAEPNTALAVN